MRKITGHEGSALNDAITIEADDRDQNGGSHRYDLRWMDPHGDYQSSQGIKFQQGPLKEAGYTGITDETLVAIVIDRLEGFNTGPFRCRENSLAITKLEEAMYWLRRRHPQGLRGSDPKV
jgi:hypothetical protein